ncbi:uncharacterized protein LOC131218990 [Magnolia sinica]|uniref:uncharacterized protein LOC131218990 n=1 Tax=Magnolia sinica TaxID=86752 RepID=UPI002657F506|nr:uncharacterized protein LOC131218990 [Magnolia sinica]
MIVCYSEVEMPPSRQSSRIDTVDLKAQIVRKLGHERAEKYLHHLRSFLSLKISKREFDKLCFMTIGRENITLHNRFIASILKNASLAKAPPANPTKEEGSSNVKFANGYSRTLQSLCGDAFPSSPRKGRSTNAHDRKFTDHRSPLGLYEKNQGAMYDELITKAVENANTTANSFDLRRPQELISIGSKALVEVASVEDGEEVEQAPGSPCIQSRSPVRAPLGILISSAGAHKALRNSLGAFHLPRKDIPQTCYNSSELPDARTLKERLERKLQVDGLGISVDCINLLNNGLDSYLRRLIKPCLEIGRARCSQEQTRQVNCRPVPGVNGILADRYVQRSDHCFSASLLDFRVAMELNPQLLGEDWSIQLEKICFSTSEK